MEQTIYDVFISYSRKDYVDEQKCVISGNVVSKIKEALTEAGITYWFDEEGIYSGQNFVEEIVSNIETSKIFVFLSTANANKSRWTCKEIASADEFGKYIIPVRIDNTPYNKKVLFRIADLDYIEYYTNPEKGIQDLIKAIKSHLDQLQMEEKLKKEEEERQKELIRKKQEEEKKQKELEEKFRQEEQRKIVSEIRMLCTTLNNEETKIELDRANLLLKTEVVADKERRDSLKSLIVNSGPIRQKCQKEKDSLTDEIRKLNESITLLETSAETANNNLEQKMSRFQSLKKPWILQKN